MPRPMWSGSISFGLINIPVKLFNAVKRKTIHFHQLRASDGCRIRLKKICEADGNEVTSEEIVKGYEVSPDQYVTVTASELESAMPKTNRAIEIDDFVVLDQIDPLYFEQPYYLTPDKGAAKAYSLLLSALKKTNKVAVARFILRNKQYLCAIRPSGDMRALTLSTMLYADEIISSEELDELPTTDAQPSEREMTMAVQLIESLTADFQPAKYHDDYRKQVLALLEKKAEGQVITTQPAAAPAGKVIDLMAALEASLAAVKKPEKAKSGRKKERAR
ncbi:DNA repair protein [Anaerosporomusa subterranea]|uniref:Non-homologous end joining protein Ku n=1 Tax=Anaerosporomusa subterranea TaxID=1794912 RepID=A0A154BMJ3_ANASB|nr:Ku protein [Anaerosporomusa subterranea]KYZ75095.1 DNA repair protein [Anaerosporomusa subterranea]